VTVYPKGDDHQQNTNGPMFTEYKMNSLARRNILIVKIKKVLPIKKRFEIPLDGIYGELLKNTQVFFCLARNVGARISKITRV
jgi:hypothetical protein